MDWVGQDWAKTRDADRLDFFFLYLLFIIIHFFFFFLSHLLTSSSTTCLGLFGAVKNDTLSHHHPLSSARAVAVFLASRLGKGPRPGKKQRVFDRAVVIWALGVCTCAELCASLVWLLCMMAFREGLDSTRKKRPWCLGRSN